MPFSRAWALAGFSRHDSERWRRAGWHDADEAARWRAEGADRTPAQLKALADRGVTPEQVPFLDEDLGVDLRDRVLRNLHRDAPDRLERALADEAGP